MKTTIRFLDDHIEEVLLVFLLAGMSLIIGLQVFMRYGAQSSLSWSEEVARYMFIWLIYVGISYGVKKERHIKIDAVANLFPGKTKIYIFILSDIIFMIFSMVVLLKSVDVAQIIFQLGQTSPSMGFPMGFVYIAVPFGFTLVLIRLIQSIVTRVRSLRVLLP